MHRRFLPTVLTVCFLWVAVPAVDADLVLDLEIAGGGTTASVASGSTVLVDMFLTDTDASSTMTAAGLNSGGGKISQTAGTATVTAGAVTAPALSLFGMPTSSVFGAAPGGLATAATVTPLFPAPVGIGATSIYIARFALTVSGSASDFATITSDVLGGTATGNFTGFSSLEDLDAVLTGGGGSFGSVTITVDSAAIPEASTLLMAGLLGMGVWYRRHRPRVNPMNS